MAERDRLIGRHSELVENRVRIMLTVAPEDSHFPSGKVHIVKHMYGPLTLGNGNQDENANISPHI